MGLITDSFKVDPRVKEAAVKAVTEGLFKSKSDAYNTILKKYFKIKNFPIQNDRTTK